jgi:hypothetical protein
MPLTTSIITTVNASLSAATKPLGTPAVPFSFSRPVELASGTGAVAGVADKAFAARRNILASANDDLDLAGVLLDEFGAAITFARIKGLFIAALPTNTNNVVIGAAGANPWLGLLNATGTITLRPGATVGAYAGVADAAGYAVTGGTGDILRVANGAAGTAVDYDILIIGAGT